jgi:phosphotriesterase-related protein
MRIPVIVLSLTLIGSGPGAAADAGATTVHAVRGPLDPLALGVTLPHEHVLVDFIGADKASRERYDSEEAFRVALPRLKELKAKGCATLLECTPAYLGRDPQLLRRLSEASGLNILTNTGYYAAGKHKYLPAHAQVESADELAARWAKEFAEGIEGTGVKPGFIKLGVDAGPLVEVDRKLIAAGARAHRKTGLAIAVHTGDGRAALEIIEVLKGEGVSPSAYVWVHAQNEKDRKIHLRACEAGAWVELDGVSEATLEDHLRVALDLIRAGHLKRLLVSQDSGWYHVGEKGGGSYRGYTFLFEKFLPELRKAGIDEAQLKTLTVDNPRTALTKK